MPASFENIIRYNVSVGTMQNLHVAKLNITDLGVPKQTQSSSRGRVVPNRPAPLSVHYGGARG